MQQDYSKPLNALPTYLSAVSMVVDDQSSIIRSLVWAERKAPPKYGPARELFCKVLQGGLTFEQALKQAENLHDNTEKDCAIDILKASKDFLIKEPRARVGSFSSMRITLPNELGLDISPVFLRHLEPQRLMVLHFWKKPLLQRQLSAAAKVLQIALIQNNFEPSNYELDFISVSQPENASKRQFRVYSWTTIKPLNDDELNRFWKLLCDAWSIYKRRDPRKIRRKRTDDLFNRHN